MLFRSTTHQYIDEYKRTPIWMVQKISVSVFKVSHPWLVYTIPTTSAYTFPKYEIAEELKVWRGFIFEVNGFWTGGILHHPVSSAIALNEQIYGVFVFYIYL